MPLNPGAWLNHYEILGHLGTGGMGEVYRARDNKLQREVALKVLPQAFAQDPERVARFRREAQVLAQVNHVNIAAIYSVEESGGTHFLVMELAEGETLKERIQESGVRSQNEPGIPLEEALDIVKQIAAGLEAAHEKPIVHRDLKPANVKVTPDGVVKILDFGLARAFAGDTGSGDPANSPTLTGMTQPGTILGTAAYMSPEQARGRRVDKRTDIWALGCVLYEMLTGKWVFQSRARQQAGVQGVPGREKGQPPLPHGRGSDDPSDTVADILGAVIHKDPDWSSLPASTPPNVRFALRRCLEKDPKRRFHSAADVAIALEEPWTVSTAEAAQTPAAPPRPLWQRIVPFSLAAIVLVALASVATWTLKPSPPQNPVHLTITLPPGDRLWDGQNPLALSPDGQRLVYVANRNGIWQLFVRSLDNPEPQPLPGTEGAAAPFFSPDSQWIGFFAEGQLKKISITGGPPFTIAEAGGVGGAAWGADDTIVFPQTINSGLMRVSADGGVPEVLTTLDRTQGEVSHRWPQFLPGDEALLFTVTDGGFAWDGSNLSVLQLNSGERRVVVRGGHTGRYVPTGHLAYYREGSLLAVPFDPVRMEATSNTSETVVEGVHETVVTIGADYSFAAAGDLAFVPGGAGIPESRLVWVDRNGEVEALEAPVRRYSWASLSPDGQQLAPSIVSGLDDVWIYGLSRGTLSRLTSEGPSFITLWTPDGSRVAYRGARAGTRNIYWRAADGTGTEERLTMGENVQTPSSFSSDGKWLVYRDQSPVTGFDLWVSPLDGEHEPREFLKTSANEWGGNFSPDGRWMAYQSDESGRYEVYVQPFPGPGRKFQVSTDGGDLPHWNPRGAELFYRSADNEMMVVDVTTNPAFRAGRPRVLFDGLERFLDFMCCEPSPDGQRFLAVQPVEPPQPATQINIVLNWFEELKQRVPVP